jgi:hypothetical protein
MKRNRRHVEATFGPRLRIAPEIGPGMAALLFEAETSGGLLFGVAPERAAAVPALLAEQGETCHEIGAVLAEPIIEVTA